MTFDELATDGATRSRPRVPSVPSTAAPGTVAVPPGPPSALSAWRVQHLQRTLGNRSTTALIRDGGTVAVQRAKPNQGARSGQVVLPGRSKRQRQAEQDELDLMEQANVDAEAQHDEDEADPTVNPFGVLADEEAEGAAAEQPGEAVDQPTAPVQPPAPVRPTLAELRADTSTAALRSRLEPYYGVEKAGHMSRVLRIGKTPVSTIEELESAAARSARDLANRNETPAPSSSRGGSLNVRTGKPVPGLTKGKGDGFRAGVGAAWHVHYDHVKYGSDAATRVNFPGRDVATIEAAVAAALARTTDRTGYEACRVWMNANLGTALPVV
ncbi:hypothetical protein [Cellulomonas fimi]|uniref:Uncharacterized protein n=1 Tax=Cellulomonas fimi (strain ATCC 484 / DSM 20113 / JCM 1341 / CCUG 24087 / LMG 16345 / NBRC 15513 / NCIMB 8980 / NCTC 7547 / NRS-133) TaxID=590998 RepID=F4H3M4_CELFA|nr:hypothetical protein [Cellulomonas fimi]AEE47690.1 hypothetical protein Celf_3581 [Cellulomonas fimi ATCC 484]NNH07445.1 hypothetical protein [Cellulomonas fimi]VEH36803.1 Uncharacterised protein [Cellulomonas fimi]